MKQHIFSVLLVLAIAGPAWGQQRVTVIFEDQTIIVDGIPAHLKAPNAIPMPPANPNWHAMQLHEDGTLIIERKQGEPLRFTGQNAQREVGPFIQAHTDELDRINSLPTPGPDPREIERDILRTKPDATPITVGDLKKIGTL